MSNDTWHQSYLADRAAKARAMRTAIARLDREEGRR